MRRREFIAALGSAAAWPAVGRGATANANNRVAFDHYACHKSGFALF